MLRDDQCCGRPSNVQRSAIKCAAVGHQMCCGRPSTVLRSATNSAAVSHKQCCDRPLTVLRSATNRAVVAINSAAVGHKQCCGRPQQYCGCHQQRRSAAPPNSCSVHNYIGHNYIPPNSCSVHRRCSRATCHASNYGSISTFKKTAITTTRAKHTRG